MPAPHHLVQIAGEEFRLRLPIANARDAQKLSGKPLAQLLSGLIALDVDCMAILLWASMQHYQHGFKLAEADALLQRWIDDGGDLEAVSTALMTTAEVSGLIRREKPKEEPEGGEKGEDPKAEG
jgi:hypothetical protein